MRFLLSLCFLVGLSFTISAQAPASSEMHRPSSFDNSYAGTLPVGEYGRSMGEERYGFLAIFEVRVSPGVIKTLDVRQYFGSEQLAVQGFMRVKASLAGKAQLVHVNWISPTEGEISIGN